MKLDRIGEDRVEDRYPLVRRATPRDRGIEKGEIGVEGKKDSLRVGDTARVGGEGVKGRGVEGRWKE